jgi:WD40 repeat protein
MAAAIVALLGLVVGLLSVRLEEAQAGLMEADSRAEKLKQKAARQRRETQLVAAHMALQRGTDELERGAIGPGMLWLVRGLELAPDDEGELRQSLRLLLAGWSGQIHPLRSLFPVTGIWPPQVAIHPKGKILARTGIKSAELWDAATGKRLGKALPHPDQVDHMKFSLDGKILATACQDGKVRLWDLATRKPVGKPMPHPGSLYLGLDFSQDGKTLITIAHQMNPDGQKVYLWEAATGKPVRKPLVLDKSRIFCGTPDGKVLVTGTSAPDRRTSKVQFWDLPAGKLLGEPMKVDFEVVSGAFTKDGKTLVLGGYKVVEDGLEPGVIRRYDGKSRKPVGRPLWHPQAVIHVSLSPDAKILLTQSRERYTQFWELAKAKPIGPPIFHSNSSGVGFSPDGRTVYLDSDAGFGLLVDPSTGTQIGDRIRSNVGGIDWFGFGPGGKTLVTSNSHELRLWSISQLARGRPLPGGRVFYDAKFSPDGRALLTGGGKGGNSAELWDRATGQLIGGPFPHAGWVVQVAFSPDGKTFLAVSDANQGLEIRRWNADTRQPIGKPILVSRPENRTALFAFRPDGKRLAVVDGKAVRWWDTFTGKARPKLLVQPAAITGLAFSPDGRFLLTAGRDQTVRRWDATTRKSLGPPLRLSAPVTFVGFSPNGRTILTVEAPPDESPLARLWDAALFQPIGEPFECQTPARGSPPLFSPDGKTLLLTDGRSVRLMDSATGKPRGEPLRYLRQVDSLALSPDGKLVATGGLHGRDAARGNERGGIRLWDVHTAKPVGPPWWLPESANPKVIFAPDGKELLALGGFHARLWNLPAPMSGAVERIRVWIEVCTGLELDAGGAVMDLDAETWQKRRERLQKMGGAPR